MLLLSLLFITDYNTQEPVIVVGFLIGGFIALCCSVVMIVFGIAYSVRLFAAQDVLAQSVPTAEVGDAPPTTREVFSSESED